MPAILQFGMATLTIHHLNLKMYCFGFTLRVGIRCTDSDNSILSKVRTFSFSQPSHFEKVYILIISKSLNQTWVIIYTPLSISNHIPFLHTAPVKSCVSMSVAKTLITFFSH